MSFPEVKKQEALLVAGALLQQQTRFVDRQVMRDLFMDRRKMPTRDTVSWARNVREVASSKGHTFLKDAYKQLETLGFIMRHENTVEILDTEAMRLWMTKEQR